MDGLKLGLIGYTNRTSGLGNVNYGLNKWLKPDSLLSVFSPKGQREWGQRQYTIPEKRQIHPNDFIKYLETYRPDVLLAVETFFGPEICGIAQAYGVKTVLIPMHEVYMPGQVKCDLFLCPNAFCLSKIEERNKALFHLPIDSDDFLYVQRTGKPRRFLHNFGYGYLNNKRQISAVIDAVLALPLGDFKLIVNTQMALAAHGYPKPANPHLRFRTAYDEPQAAYRDMDILVQPEAYAGFGLTLIEAQLCGMPIVTTNAPPMNEYVDDERFLVPVAEAQWLQSREFNATYNRISPLTLAAVLGRLLDLDLAELSASARARGEKWAWNDDKVEQLTAILKGLL